jgi:hypothetical protein
MRSQLWSFAVISLEKPRRRVLDLRKKELRTSLRRSLPRRRFLILSAPLPLHHVHLLFCRRLRYHFHPTAPNNSPSYTAVFIYYILCYRLSTGIWSVLAVGAEAAAPERRCCPPALFDTASTSLWVNHHIALKCIVVVLLILWGGGCFGSGSLWSGRDEGPPTEKMSALPAETWPFR